MSLAMIFTNIPRILKYYPRIEKKNSDICISIIVEYLLERGSNQQKKSTSNYKCEKIYFTGSIKVFL